MKIAVISTSTIPSTTANSIQVMKVCQAYAQLGIDVSLYIPGDEKYSWLDLADIYGLHTIFKIIWIKPSRKLRSYDFALKATLLAKKWGAHVVHTWSVHTALILDFKKFPYLLELHELPSGKFGPYLYKRVFQSWNKKRFLPITNALWIQLTEHYSIRIEPNNVVISPDGVDFERYESLPIPSKARTQLGLPERWSAVYTGHLYPGRGMQLLIELAISLPDVQFVWVGGNPVDIEIWRSQVISQKIDNIVLTGFIKNEKIPLYQAAGDVLLMPYEKSIQGSSGGNTVDICSPMKMFEYMATGRPIISSDLPVLREVLNEENSIFCEVENSSEWINTIKNIRKNPQVFAKLANQARLDVAQYTWKQRCENGLRGFIDE